MSATTSFEGQTTVYNLGPVERIPAGEGRTFQLNGRAVAVFRARDGRLLATQAYCPHRAGLLSDGLIGDGMVVCPLHAYKFSLASGQPVGNDCEALKTYRVALDDAGDIVLTLSNEVEETLLYEQSQRSACRPFRSANE